MMFQIRILPLTMAALALVLLIKIADTIEGNTRYSRQFLISDLQAEEEAGEEEKAAEEDGHADEGEEESHGDEEAHGEESGHEGGDEHGGGLIDLGPTEEELAALQQERERLERERAKKFPEFTKIEIDLLQSLSERREELEEWESRVQLRENLLAATESRLEEKVAELETLKTRIEELLLQYDKQEERKIQSLVKIYESMKPKDAARVMEQVDMPILLEIVDRMSERKAAPILAKMDPLRAKEVTIELAEQRRLPGRGAPDPDAMTPEE